MRRAMNPAEFLLVAFVGVGFLLFASWPQIFMAVVIVGALLLLLGRGERSQGDSAGRVAAATRLAQRELWRERTSSPGIW